MSHLEITQKEAAKQLGVSTRTIIRWIERGKLTTTQTDKGFVLTQGNVDDFVAEKRLESKPITRYDIPYVGDIVEGLGNHLKPETIKTRTIRQLTDPLRQLEIVEPIKRFYRDVIVQGLLHAPNAYINVFDFEESLAHLMIDLNYRMASSSTSIMDDQPEVEPEKTLPDMTYINSYVALTEMADDGNYQLSTYEDLKERSKVPGDELQTKINMLTNLRLELTLAYIREPQASRKEELRIYALGLSDHLLELSWIQFKTLIYKIMTHTRSLREMN